MVGPWRPAPPGTPGDRARTSGSARNRKLDTAAIPRSPFPLFGRSASSPATTAPRRYQQRPPRRPNGGAGTPDRKSVVSRKSGDGRGELGGRRIIKKKK